MAISHTASRSTIEELAEHVYTLLSVDGNSVHDAFHAVLPKGQHGPRTEHELDYVDFGITVGLAYGIASGEDPFESWTSIAERAGAAAVIAHERWSSWHVSYLQDRAFRPMPDYPAA